MKTDVYKEARVFEYPGAIVRVHVPILNDEERSRRMERIKEAAANLLKSKRRKQ